MDLGYSERFFLVMIAGLAAVILLRYLYGRWQDKWQGSRRARFVQQVGGVEHTRTGGTRPRFGYFPEPDDITPPFHWAIESTRSGYHALVYETRDVRVRYRDNSRHTTTDYSSYVELPIPAGPPVKIGDQRMTNYFRHDGTAAQLVAGTAAERHGRYVLCPDPEFARVFVTDALAAAIAGHKRGRWVPGTDFIEGTARRPVPQGRTFKPRRCST